MDDDCRAAQDDTSSSLSNLPIELLVVIFSYLPLLDKMRMQLVSPKFKYIMEVPSLWKDFVWPNYQPLQVCSGIKILKTQGEHVRRIFFPAHVSSANILKMAQCCTKVTDLSLPRNVSLNDLEKIVHTMKHLHQLDVFVNSAHMESRLLATTVGVKKLTISYSDTIKNSRSLENLLEGMKQQGDSLPSVINIHVPRSYCTVTNQLLQFWSAWSSKLPSCEVALYEIIKVPMNLYPSMPLMRVKFGSAATPPLIKLTDHGILGLKYNTFHFTDYDDHGEVRHTITAQRYGIYAVKEQDFNCINNLYSVSNVDFCDMDIYPGHLEQLAVACPNLERINLRNATNCLQSLKGLQVLVDKCRNLQGINLAQIPTVECHLLLWVLLSSVKKLTHLAINLSFLTYHGDYDDDDQQTLIGLLNSCSNLKALEISDEYWDFCAVDPKQLLFSHFPSLVFVGLGGTSNTILFEYTIINCHQLKYLCYYCWNRSIHHIRLPSSSSCHLQQLYLRNVGLSAASVHVLSAHGELEQVILSDVIITTSSITTLISNSPNLILLNITPYDSGLKMKDCKKKMSEKFTKHKLFTVGDCFINCNYHQTYNHATRFDSFW